jgi:hypothetical protein
MTPSEKPEEIEGRRVSSAHDYLEALKPLDRVKVKFVEPIHREKSTINEARRRYILGGEDEAFEET